MLDAFTVCCKIIVYSISPTAKFKVMVDVGKRQETGLDEEEEFSENSS
jgi:hypothetical protein